MNHKNKVNKFHIHVYIGCILFVYVFLSLSLSLSLALTLTLSLSLCIPFLFPFKKLTDYSSVSCMVEPLVKSRAGEPPQDLSDFAFAGLVQTVFVQGWWRARSLGGLPPPSATPLSYQQVDFVWYFPSIFLRVVLHMVVIKCWFFVGKIWGWQKIPKWNVIWV